MKLSVKPKGNKIRVTISLPKDVQTAISKCCVKGLKTSSYTLKGREVRQRYKVLETVALISTQDELALFDKELIDNGYFDIINSIDINAISKDLKTSVARCCVIYDKFKDKMTQKKIKEAMKNG